MSNIFTLHPGKLTAQDLLACLEQTTELKLADTTWAGIKAQALLTSLSQTQDNLL